jgi:TM2 domain-containing membrane protein YozV
VAESNESLSSNQTIPLKDPFVAGILAWLIPGLGHFYQGRNAKGALYAICILGTFIYGLYLGGSKQLGWGRAVYFQFDEKEWRLYWLCQAGVGFPTVPMTLLQAKLQDKPIINGFMAPPADLARINRLLPHYFELGTIYTVIAGLLNILAVYDACCGPVAAESAKKEDDEKRQGKRDQASKEEKP